MMLNLYPLYNLQPPPYSTPGISPSITNYFVCTFLYINMETYIKNVSKLYCFFPIYNNKEKIIFEHTPRL